jgi:hypothetical protein
LFGARYISLAIVVNVNPATTPSLQGSTFTGIEKACFDAANIDFMQVRVFRQIELQVNRCSQLQIQKGLSQLRMIKRREETAPG